MENIAVMKATADKAAKKVDKAAMEMLKWPPWNPIRYLGFKLLTSLLAREMLIRRLLLRSLSWRRLRMKKLLLERPVQLRLWKEKKKSMLASLKS